MPLNDILFSTDGTWDNTNVFNLGNPLPCRRIFLDLKTYGEADGESGVDEGGSLTGWVDYVREGFDNDPNPPLDRADIFPGAIEFQIKNKVVRVECTSREGNFLDTRVFVDGFEMTEEVVRVFADIDAIDDRVTVWYKFKSGEVLDIAEYQEVTLI
jgi:hypothetical protein